MKYFGAADTRIQKNSPERIPELDGLRGTAILFVIVFHYFIQHIQAAPATPGSYLLKYFSILWIGVDVFFVLSGYLVGGIVLDKIVSERFFRVFYLRRFLRIAPPYLILLIFYASLKAHGGAERMEAGNWLFENLYPFWAYFFYIQNFCMAWAGSFGGNFLSDTWSLAIEEQFYLLFPLLVCFSSSKKLPWFLISLVLLAPVMRIYLFYQWPNQGLPRFVLLPARWDSLLLGVLVAWIVRRKNASELVSKYGAGLRGGVICTGLAVAVLPLLKNSQFSFGMAVYGHLLVALSVALVLLAVLMNKLPFVSAILRQGWLRFIGRISYTLYLFHKPFLGIIFSIILKKAPIIGNSLEFGVATLSLACAVSFSYLTWELFEKKLVGIGHRYGY